MNRRDFDVAIASGFERLYALSLPGSPDPDVIELAVRTWTDTLWSTATWEDADLDRIAAGFRLLARHCERWPAPAQFLNALPQRVKTTTREAPMSDEEIVRNKQRIAEILQMLVQKTSMEHGPS